MLKYSRRAPLSYKYMTLRLLREIFIVGINSAKQKLSKIKNPLLLLGGAEDNLIKSQNSHTLIKHFKSNDETLKVYQNACHRLARSPKKDEGINDISTWTNKRGVG